MKNKVNGRVEPSSATAWFFGAAVATAVGITATGTATPLPGAEPLDIEDVVDAIAEVALGGLGLVLVRRGVATGLGRALLLTAALAGCMWLCAGLADVIAGGSTPPRAAQLLALASTVLFLPVLVLLVIAPMLLFPTGRLPSPRWRWVLVTAVSGTLASMVSLLLAPGALDEDVPAWGSNPLGVDALDGLTSLLEAVGAMLLLVALPASVAAVIVRMVRSTGPRRRQMWWFAAGVAPLLVGLVTDTGSSSAASLISAIVAFAGLLGGMAWALLGAPGRDVVGQTRQALDTAPAQAGTRLHT